MGILKWLGRILSPIERTIDELNTSEEEKMQLKNALAETQSGLSEKLIDLEAKVLEATTKRIEAETKSDNVLVKTWRPITSLALVACIILSAYGIGSPGPQLFELAKIILGGYIGGRSLEKVVAVSKLGK